MSDETGTGGETRKRVRRSRAERAHENREALLNAAADVVGESGYEGATIVEVTRRAGLSPGSFYQYFESREDLFHQLLPAVGEKLLAVLAQSSHDAPDAVESEARAIRAYFDFLRSGSPIMRVFREAEIYAPDTHAAYLDDVLDRYQRSLLRRKEAGEFAAFDRDELMAVALLLTTARVEFMRFMPQGTGDSDWIETVFVKIVRQLARGD